MLLPVKGPAVGHSLDLPERIAAMESALLFCCVCFSVAIFGGGEIERADFRQCHQFRFLNFRYAAL